MIPRPLTLRPLTLRPVVPSGGRHSYTSFRGIAAGRLRQVIHAAPGSASVAIEPRWGRRKTLPVKVGKAEVAPPLPTVVCTLTVGSGCVRDGGHRSGHIRRGQKGQLPGAGASIRRSAPPGSSCTAIVSAGALVSLRSRCTSVPPGSTKPAPAA